MTREVRHLNHGWRFAPDHEPEYLVPTFDDAAFAVVDLPHSVADLPYDHTDTSAYEHLSTYRRALDPGPLDGGRRAILHLEGVATAAEVYVEGVLAGTHVGGYTPFAVDVTDHLAPTGPSALAVVVDSRERADIPPFGGAVDYLGYGGIYREVHLEVVGPVRLGDVALRPHGVLTRTARLEVDVDVLSGVESAERLEIDVAVLRRDDDAGAALATGRGRVRTAAGAPSSPASAQVTIAVALPGVELWSPEKPILHDVEVTLRRGADVLDAITLRTGFREAVFRPDGFFLNGRRLTLRGLNRHQSFPYVGPAMPRSAQVRDAEILVHDLGVNVVRLSHYPQSRHFLDACDDLGLLALEEMPGWQHIGDAAWKANAVADVEAMVRRDRHRPCVIGWGVRINESVDDDDFYAATNAAAHRLDPTRQTFGVRNFAGSRLLEDVYTYNDFVHDGSKPGLRPAREVAGRRVPYLVTEHTGHMFPTKAFDTESRRLEHALRHLRVLDAAYGAPDVSGAIGWCMTDYATHRAFGSGDRICHHGVLDAFRNPKLAAAAYASQQDDQPVLEFASAVAPGDLDGSEIRSLHIFTNCDYVRLSRDGQEVGTFHPDRETFPSLPHPPIVVRDLIGRALERNEGFTRKDAERIKELFAVVAEHGLDGLPAVHRARMARLVSKYGLSTSDTLALYGRYVAGWGSAAVRYDVEGFRDGVRVATATRSADGVGHLDVRADAATLVEGETYDVCRVVIAHVDAFGHPQVYSDAVVRLDVDGPGRILGPSTVGLIGGARAFWVRSVGEPGRVRVSVTSERFGTHAVDLEVRVESGTTDGARLDETRAR